MLNQCNLVELFSGIGSQAKALKNLNIKVNTVGTCEWDVHAIAAYDVIHNSAEIPQDISSMTKDELLEKLSKYTFSNSGKAPLEYSSFKTYSVEVLRRLYASILRNKNSVDITEMRGSELPSNIDILTYSFPCQDLSNVGAFHGYNKGIDKNSGSRSSLLWQVGRVLEELKDSNKALPRFLLMENVPTLLSKRHFANFSMWISDLEQLGYISKYYQLNASSFGLPQNRPRLLMISVYVGENEDEKQIVNDYFSIKDEAAVISDYCTSEHYMSYKVQDLLRTNYSNHKIYAEALDCTPNDTVSRRKIWEDNPQIILPDGSFNTSIDAIRTITTKQDRNPNSGNLYFESGVEGRSKFRYLTPRECLLFMGFTDEDYRKLKYNNIEFHKGDALFARDKIIRMSGNSIPVKLLEGIFYQIIQLEALLEKHREEIALEESNLYPDIIRSYMFSKGIRSRINKEPYPLNASIVYPKYKAAIYICEHMDEGNTRSIEAQHMGWNALIVPQAALRRHKRRHTLKWIESVVRDCIEKPEERGVSIYCG